jgi:3-hydroxybutyryl-CoA dehydrogenase
MCSILEPRRAKALEKSLAGRVKTGKMDEAARDEVLDRISFTAELKDAAGSDLVIEAIRRTSI